ncbi:MAG: hypothetical protein ACE5JN_03265 [Candidatus Methylomirabilia bacterium]
MVEQRERSGLLERLLERLGLTGDHAPDRPWLLIVASLVLALMAAGAGIAWRHGVARERQLRAELRQVYEEAEMLRTYAVQWQERAEFLEKQLSALKKRVN